MCFITDQKNTNEWLMVRWDFPCNLGTHRAFLYIFTHQVIVQIYLWIYTNDKYWCEILGVYPNTQIITNVGFRITRQCCQWLDPRVFGFGRHPLIHTLLVSDLPPWVKYPIILVNMISIMHRMNVVNRKNNGDVGDSHEISGRPDLYPGFLDVSVDPHPWTFYPGLPLTLFWYPSIICWRELMLRINIFMNLVLP